MVRRAGPEARDRRRPMPTRPWRLPSAFRPTGLWRPWWP